jgi:hypothetical protein
MKKLAETFLLCLCLSSSATTLSAQYRAGTWGTGFRLGASPYDLDGTGTAFVLGPQADLALSRTFLGELSIMIFDHISNLEFAGFTASERTRFLLPELSLEAQATIGRFQPYLLAGGGAAIVLNGPVDGGGTLHAGIGTRFKLGENTLLRAEGRARSIRPWTGETVDFTVGIEWTKH